MSGGDYLWDKTGEPDAEVQALEERLRPLGRLPPPPQWSGRRGRRWRWLGLAAAAALALALGASLLRTRPATRPGHGWELAWLEGASWSDARVVRAETLAEGEWIETREARARLAVGREGDEIGQVRLEPGTRIGLVDPGDRRHRLSLARGVIHATIWAPAWRLRRRHALGRRGRHGLPLHARGGRGAAPGCCASSPAGSASSTAGSSRSCPAGALCATRKGVGPGTPFFESATPGLRSGARGDRLRPAGGSRRARPWSASSPKPRARDALSLWHLLSRTAGEERGRVYDRLHALVPAPPA